VIASNAGQVRRGSCVGAQPQVAISKRVWKQAGARKPSWLRLEYHRAESVGASGALSAEGGRRAQKSSAVTAAAKFKVAAALLAKPGRLARGGGAGGRRTA